MKRSRLCIVLLILCVIITSCGEGKDDNFVFVGTVEEIYETGIMITTTEDIGFDRASVGFAEGVILPSDITVGQAVEIEALPEIRESYPVQITAVKITLVDAAIEE
jgi:hypothetical protein